MNAGKFISETIQSSIGTKQSILADRLFMARVAKIADAAVKVCRSGRKILLAGNGGSAADAQHLAGEFVNRFRFDRPALPAVALSTDTSVMTAIANDSSFERIFARQIEALGAKGDMFIGFSTSGSSPNILKALKQCRKMKIVAVGFTGEKSAKMAGLCDYCLAVPSQDTPRIQEAHIMLGHILCEIIETRLFKPARS
ncbi:MAG: D-sedoheptulose 7-phosphate isomerase [Kiritimatiellae bacterium]|jgi:D-sedoheptulose 7-phosphate isomerase|nr:D-sedoheptulose 7-phosphate isomerase [Kiritimatiellia bacterium]